MRLTQGARGQVYFREEELRRLHGLVALQGPAAPQVGYGPSRWRSRLTLGDGSVTVTAFNPAPLQIEYDPSRVELPALKEAIEDCGFDADITDEQQSEPGGLRLLVVPGPGCLCSVRPMGGSSHCQRDNRRS